MQRRKLGGLEVSAVGLGCGTMTPFYDAPDPESAVATIRRARELGIDFLDTSDAYGLGRNGADRRRGRGASRRLRDRQQIRQCPAAGWAALCRWPSRICQGMLR